MPLSPLAGKPATPDMLINENTLIRAYYSNKPDLANPTQLVSFGTSGHRGTSGDSTFTESHIKAITQAIVDYRKANNITGPLYIGKDSHALSAPAQATALSVLAANEIETIIAADKVSNWTGCQFTPTPVISHAILCHNRHRKTGHADGIVITPSHNPPADGGFKYNPTNGGPADTDITTWIQNQANTYLNNDNKDVKHIPYDKARKSPFAHYHDYITPYVSDLPSVIDITTIRNSKINIGVDPLGGASLAYWQAITDLHNLNITIVNNKIDPTFSFMTVDHDGKIRMDCSSPYAMASLLSLRDKFPIAVANDPDSDRHGIVTPTGLMNPNHYLAVAIQYLLTHRPQWNTASAIGKTVVSSSMINRVVADLGRNLFEVPVGFKWFAPGLFDGSVCFGGEESAGASFLRLNGQPWSTDKDGIILALLAAEITATTTKNPSQHYADLTEKFGNPAYTRVDAPASPAHKAAFKKLTPDRVTAAVLAGDPITAKLTNAPGNNAPIGGLKIETSSGWFAARPSGTENIYKIYAESFKGEDHLKTLLTEAESLVNTALAS